MARRFVDMCADYNHHFRVHGHDLSSHARDFLSGVLGTQARKNLERIEADIPGSSYQNLQQFISDSPWSHEAVMQQVSCEADELLGGYADSALMLDETSFVKKGRASVGVARQYCGRLGKLDNCQVAVFGCMSRGRHAALVDYRLYLPKEWVQDAARCQKAKVPQDRRQHWTKPQLALQIVQAARQRGSSHRWIGADEIYGNNQEFCAQLEDMGETFLMDVARNTRVWTARPSPQSPPRIKQTARGRPYSALQPSNAQSQETKIQQLVAQHFASQSQEVSLRQSTQGLLRARVWVCEVWLWDRYGAPQERRRLLVVRQEADGSFKYSLSNAPADTSWSRLALMQAQRYWIEQSFKEAKSQLGMAHYEVRGWRGWHHHMALVCLAQLFTVRERMAAWRQVPLLSARDIVELLEVYLPRRQRDENEVLRQLVARHQKRKQAIQSHIKRRRRRKRDVKPDEKNLTM
jgi:SRSO17 transposase